MAASRHHAEWLSLIEVAGPFLTLPVLERVFPQGLDKDDSPEAKAHARHLRLAYDEWDDNESSHRPNPAIHKAWIDFVLKQTLGLPDEVMAEGQDIPQTLKANIALHGEVLRPDVLVRNPEGVPNTGKPRLLVQIHPSQQDLERPIVGRHWNASPASRMADLLRATDVRLGLVTNGEHWMLVDAPRDRTAGFASWYATLWFDEPLTLRAFRSLLGVSRFFSVADLDTLEAMLVESVTHQKEVTDQLGLQVRQAVAVLIQSLDRADQDHERKLLREVSEAVLYEAALTVMMRLVFLFYAEENKLIPAQTDDELYLQHYAVSTILDQLQEAADQHGEEVLERRLDAYTRLLAIFRAVFGGVQHERMKLPAYGGNLFNPDRFPFLEGRKSGTMWRDTPATPLPVNNRTVLHLLRSLQYLQGERKEDLAVRLSFQSLGIEQIGHVYEGLLDHTAKRAAEPMLGLLGAKGKETEVALAAVERLKDKGESDLIAFLNDQTGRQEKTLNRGLDTPLEGEDAKKLRATCGNEEKLFQRVLRFSGLLRNDTFDRPVVVRTGSIFVTEGTDRRSSGTHYTPPELTEPIVRYTLEPLVYVGPAEGKPEDEWNLRSAKELLDLKICDMACGSGAFLVQACRYLSQRLVEAWMEREEKYPEGTRITPYGEPSKGVPSEQPIPTDTNERLAFAHRIVAQRCLYGVDKNHLAVEMAKLSLWLLTVAKDKPFTFLDHAIRTGDSLVGIKDLGQLKNFHLEADQPGTLKFKGPLEDWVDDAIALRKKIEAAPANTVEDVQAKEKLLAEVEAKTARLRCAADLLLSVEFQEAPEGKERLHNSMAIQAGYYVEKGTVEEFSAAARKGMRGNPTFHWPLEFPEVLVDRGGFDAFVCNPPFMGGKKITGVLGTAYRNYLVEHLANNKKGSADLCAYFFLRAKTLLRENGQFGFLATNTIAQGDTREVSLESLVASGCTVPRAVPSRKWPGTANLEVAHVWVRLGQWSGPFVLDETHVPGITPFLTTSNVVGGPPSRLSANRGRCFQGSNIVGIGFVVSQEEAHELLKQNERNSEVLFPYLNGEDLNSQVDQSATRWVINFFDWPLDRKSAASDYRGPVASDYPACLEVVRAKVKPERDRLGLKNDASAKGYAKFWWQFGRKAIELYSAIREKKLRKVFAVSLVTHHVAIALVPAAQVFAHRLGVFPSSDSGDFSVLQSNVHEPWARAYSSSLESRLNYSPSDCCETFPFPLDVQGLRKIGDEYLLARQQIMTARQEGLTKVYNRLHDSEEKARDVEELRALHAQMDNAVVATYGWHDLNLGHGFHETKQGGRNTISEPARHEILARLLRLNHERYAEEVKQGLHEKKGKGKKPSSGRGRKSSPPAGGKSLFDEGNEEDPEPKDDDQLEPESEAEPTNRPVSIDLIDADTIMAAFRQATRGRGWLERDELLKDVSLTLGFQRLGPKIDETLRGHLRAAIRRRIIEADGASLVRAGTGTMADYGLDELRETFRSVMRKGTNYEREDVIHALARYLGFARVTDTSRDAIKSAINSAIRHGVLGYEGSVIWREE